MTLFYDSRWLGPHGIGRFAAEVAKRCDMAPLPLSGKPFGLMAPWRLTETLKKLKPGHFFSPGFSAPLGAPCPFSLTLHDLIHLDVREESSLSKRIYYESVIRPAARRAKVIFSDSEFSRERISAWLGVDSAPIKVVGCGVSEAFRPDGPRWVHDRPYFLYVGNQKPHKNVGGLIRAFSDSGVSKDFDLLVTGQCTSSVKALVGGEGLDQRVKAVGLLSDESLASLYRGATSLVMPSRYEGFGLPVLEAMASGTAVLSSNSASLPEVGGEAVCYFDPEDHDSLVEGLKSMTDVDHLKTMRAQALSRARDFAWEKVAASVKAAIEA